MEIETLILRFRDLVTADNKTINSFDSLLSIIKRTNDLNCDLSRVCNKFNANC